MIQPVIAPRTLDHRAGPRGTHTWLIAIFIVAPILSGPAYAARIRIDPASAFYVANVTIPTNTTVTFETSGCTPATANPALHLLRVNGAQVTQVAFNDDFAGLGNNSRISHTNSNSITSFMLVMRSTAATTTGSCNVLLNNASFQNGAPVGGQRITAGLLTFTAGNRLRSTHVPGGSVLHALVSFSPNFSTILAVQMGNAPGGAADLLLGGTETDFLVGTPRIRDTSGVLAPQPRTGNVRILANDVQTDTDSDSLGNALEVELGTCASMTGCGNNAFTSKDSDRDGLSDGDEVLGVAGTLTGALKGQDDLPFARWGASPIHKDVFVEVDYINAIGGGVPAQVNPFQWLRNNPNQPGLFYNGTVESWVTALRAPYLAGPNAHLQNPDQAPGVSVHLDIGVAPTTPANETFFGAYGTSSSYAVEPDWVLTLNGPITGNIRVIINGVPSAFQQVTGMSAMQLAVTITQLTSSVSQGAVTLRSSATNGLGQFQVVHKTSVAGNPFTASVQVPVGQEAAITQERTPSSFIMYNNDIDQVRSNRRGRFRYAVAISTGGGSGGTAAGPTFVSGVDMPTAGNGISTFMHELGHTVGIEHWGHQQWSNGFGNDCMPQYLSLMGYGIPIQAFSSVASPAGIPLNPSQALEENPFGAGFGYASFVNSPWFYTIQGGNRVDWNRDSTGEAGAALWRSPAMALYNASCQAFGQDRTRISFGTAPVVGAVDLVRSGTRLYAFWSEGAIIRYRFATLGALGNKSCTGTADPTAAGDCLSWSPAGTTYSIDVADTYQGVTVSEFGGQIFVGYRTTSNQIHVVRCNINAGGTVTVVASYNLSNGNSETQTTAAPELVRLNDDISLGTLGVIYLDLFGRYRLKRWSDPNWNPAAFGEQLIDGNLATIPGTMGPAAKSWPDSSVAWNANERRTVAVLPDDQNRMRIHVLDYDNQRWVRTATLQNPPVPPAIITQTFAKPFIEYRHMRHPDGAPLNDFAGHFLFGWGENHASGTRAMMRFSTLVRRTLMPDAIGNLLGTMQVGDFLSNQWAYNQTGTSAALYSDSTIDNVFGLVALNIPGQVGVWFYPHADGSPNHTYTVFSDYRIMEDEVCRVLENNQGQPCGTVDVKLP